MPGFRIVPCLWFDHQAEEAARFYTGIFPHSRIVRVTRYGEEGRDVHGRPPGSVMVVAFELDGHPFTALNGGPVFTFNEAVSMQVMCDSQAEIDRYWHKLGEGGDERARQCGWLKDRFGLSWQVVPRILPDLIGENPDARSERVWAALLGMQKIDVAALKRAHEGR
jgi:predicted 3-demethylubiquinone-9 3-methyltransferase (glyoxalase superfamily)